MTDKTKKNPVIGILILVGIAVFIYGFNTIFGVDFENPDSVKKGMQGTWVVHEHDNGDWIHARVTIKGDTYKFRYTVTEREKFNDWNGLPVTEGRFEIEDIKTYTNTTTEYRPIAFMGTTLESSIASRKIFFDKSMGLYWGQWGEMKDE